LFNRAPISQNVTVEWTDIHPLKCCCILFIYSLILGWYFVFRFGSCAWFVGTRWFGCIWEFFHCTSWISRSGHAEDYTSVTWMYYLLFKVVLLYFRVIFELFCKFRKFSKNKKIKNCKLGILHRAEENFATRVVSLFVCRCVLWYYLFFLLHVMIFLMVIHDLFIKVIVGSFLNSFFCLNNN
jgi:hypothetical protein